MIIYSPLDGEALTSAVRSRPRHCFLMTQLGGDIPEGIQIIRAAVTRICQEADYGVIDARTQVTGGDFLLKIWKLIASTPFSVAVGHEQIPSSTQLNIYYELGVAQALGKETLLVKSPGAEVPSDLVRTEYVAFDDDFDTGFRKYLNSLQERADHYELVADQLERNPVSVLMFVSPCGSTIYGSRSPASPRFVLRWLLLDMGTFANIADKSSLLTCTILIVFGFLSTVGDVGRRPLGCRPRPPGYSSAAAVRRARSLPSSCASASGSRAVARLFLA